MDSDVRESVGHRSKRQDFDQAVSRKHFLTNQDVRNVRRSVLDRQIKRHENDATSSVSLCENYNCKKSLLIPS